MLQSIWHNEDVYSSIMMSNLRSIWHYDARIPGIMMHKYLEHLVSWIWSTFPQNAKYPISINFMPNSHLLITISPITNFSKVVCDEERHLILSIWSFSRPKRDIWFNLGGGCRLIAAKSERSASAVLGSVCKLSRRDRLCHTWETV